MVMKNFVNSETGEVVNTLPNVPVVEYVELKSYNKLDYHNRRKKIVKSCLFLEKRFNPDKGYFLTLTYDPRNLPETPVEVRESFQLFMKRLRRWHEYRGLPTNFRYFAVVEHGDENGRVHWHCLIWGISLESVKLMTMSNSYGINIWNQGFVKSSCITNKRIHYCIKYLFKQFDNQIVYKSLCSHGLGYDYDGLRRLGKRMKCYVFRAGKYYRKVPRHLLAKMHHGNLRVRDLSKNRMEEWKNIVYQANAFFDKIFGITPIDYRPAIVLRDNVFTYITLSEYHLYQHQIECNRYDFRSC